MSGRALLLGIDGATFTLLDPFIDEGVMPFLGRMVADGVHCTLASTPHPYTPQAWTALATGCGPGETGIFDFIRVELGEHGLRYMMATSHDLRRETIWSIAARQGRRAASLNFPVSFPPRPLDGAIVPGFVPPRHLRRFVYPAGLYKRLTELPGFDPSELLLNLELERTPLEMLPADRYEDWIRVHIRREAQWAAIAELLLVEEGCDFLAMIFDGADKLQHLCWRLLDPALVAQQPTRWERRIRALCLDYYRALDEHLEHLCDVAGGDARVVVCSDHGFTATREIFYANVLLAEHGYLRFSDRAPSDAAGRHMIEAHRNPAELFDWTATKAVAITAGSNGIYVRRGEGGICPASYDSFVERLAQTLLAYRDPTDGGPVVRRILFREDVFAGAANGRAPDLTLALRDHGFLSVLRSASPLRRRPQILGTHHPDGVLVARGPGIRSGARIETVSILDVAALLLHSLGLPLPIDMQAELPTEVFEPEWLSSNPPRPGPPTEPPAAFETQPPQLDKAGETQVLERLRALGYVE